MVSIKTCGVGFQLVWENWHVGTYHAAGADDLFGDRVPEADLAIQRVLLVVGDQVHQALKLGRADDE